MLLVNGVVVGVVYLVVVIFIMFVIDCCVVEWFICISILYNMIGYFEWVVSNVVWWVFYWYWLFYICVLVGV